MPNLLFPCVLAIALVNGLAIFAFWHDKRRAQRGGWRVREADLLGLAIFGGSPGALLARRWFRHKTRKEPFSSRLITIATLQGAVVIGLAIGLA